MSTTYDRFDKAREQYISYNLNEDKGMDIII